MKNVDKESIIKFVEEAKKDKGALKKSKKVEVEWEFDENEVQMKGKVEYATGSRTLESDMQSFLGGKGRAPDPMQYCLFGIASCYGGIFSAIATEKNLDVSSFKVTAENNLNLSQTFGLSEEPIVEKMKLTVQLRSNSKKEEIEEVMRLAAKRCPGVYCLTNPIPLEFTLEVVE